MKLGKRHRVDGNKGKHRRSFKFASHGVVIFTLKTVSIRGHNISQGGLLKIMF